MWRVLYDVSKAFGPCNFGKRKKRSHEARPEGYSGRDNTVSFSDFKVSSQTQMYVMEHYHEVDEQA